MYSRTAICKALALAFGGSLIIASLPAGAQETTPQRIEVTGSRVKRTDAETASPVQVLTRQDIEATGKQSIQEVLRGITSDSNGTIPTSFSNGFASGSSAVSLRGLGVNSTLVLVNGRRMSTYGLADDGTRTFVDLNSLPLEAVDRIEVLKDGASAIYGADAVGGVVNVILRKNYTGFSIGGSYGQTSKSDGQQTRIFGSAGFGNLDTDRYNVFFTVEASKQKNIWARDRGFLGESDLRSMGYYDTRNGVIRNYLGVTTPSSTSPYGTTRAADGTGQRVNVIQCDPSAIIPESGLCGYNFKTDGLEIQPEIERLNFFGRGTFQFTPSLTGYAELGFFNTRSSANGTLGGNNDGGVYLPGDPLNPLVVHGFMNLPAGHPDNTFGVDRSLFIAPMELGGRDQRTNNKVYRVIAGVQGQAFNWDYDVGVGYIKSELVNKNFGYIRYDVMQEALNNGTYRINSPNTTDPAVLQAISPTLITEPTSSVKLIDFKATGQVGVTLPGGPLSVAVGAEHRWEEADNPPVPFTDTGEIVGLGYSAFSQKRRVTAVYGEVVAPVTKWLELNGALRYDRYSDFGNTTNPKVGFKLTPLPQFAVRGTYAEAFRAPGPAETGGASFGFTTYGILSQGNPNIQPETSKSYTLGLVLEPIPGTSATIDFWKVDRKNEIVQADPSAIIPAGQCVAACDGTAGNPDFRTNSQQPGSQPNTFLYYDINGDLQTVTGFYRNAASTKTDGVDLELRHRMNLGSAGKLTAQMNWSHTRSLKRTDPDGNTFEYAGTHGPLVQSSGTGSPKDKIVLSATLDRGSWAVTGTVNYTGKIKMVDHKGEQSTSNGDGTIVNENTGVFYPDAGQYDCGVFDTNGNVWNGCKLPSFTTFDLYAKWTPIKNLDINFSIQNVFGRKAPFDPYLVVPYVVNYNQAYHQSGAVGRFFTIGARYSF